MRQQDRPVALQCSTVNATCFSTAIMVQLFWRVSPPAACTSAAGAEVLPANFRVSLSLFSVHPLNFKKHQNRRHETVVHHYVGDRLSHLLYRLRQPARRKRRKEKCHSDLRSLRCHMQRYASKVCIVSGATPDPAFLRHLFQDCCYAFEARRLPLGLARKAI
jgi:hypothetical protein